MTIFMSKTWLKTSRKFYINLMTSRSPIWEIVFDTCVYKTNLVTLLKWNVTQTNTNSFKSVTFSQRTRKKNTIINLLTLH